VTARATKWRFSHPVYAALMVGAFFTMIGFSKATNAWRTSPEKISVRDSAGELDPETIRGWMTRADISREFEIPIERLYTDSGLPKEVADTVMIKEIHNEYEIEFEPDILRDVVGAYVAGEPPPDLEAMRAREPSARRKERDARRAEYAETHPEEADQQKRSPEGKGRGRGGGQGQPAEKGDEDHEPPAVRGNSTINGIVLETGIPRDYLLKEAGLPDDVPLRTPLRDWMMDYDVRPRDLRDIVEEYLDEKR
jgi:hypothetical protein